MSLGSDYLRSLLEEDPERGVYRCKREMFTAPATHPPHQPKRERRVC